jgi:hypothetical protein
VNQKRLIRLLLLLGLVAVLVYGTRFYQKKTAHQVEPLYRIEPSPVGTNQTVLQKTFSLKKSASFPFEIPAHAVRPNLHGTFDSFVGEEHGGSDDAANLDFLILSDEQYADFVSGRPGEALFSVEASHSQNVNFDLPAALDHPKKYYLVFRASDAGPKRVVKADFSLDF